MYNKSPMFSLINAKQMICVTAIPFVKEHGTGKHGSQKLLAVMNCFRGDLPEVEGIVGM